MRFTIFFKVFSQFIKRLRFEKINQHSNVLQCSMQKYEKHKNQLNNKGHVYIEALFSLHQTKPTPWPCLM